MKSSDLVLFRDICDSLDKKLYNTLQNPDDDFKDKVESGEYFEYLSDKQIEYDFEDMQKYLKVTLRYYQRLSLYFTKYYFEKRYLLNGNEKNKLTYWMATGSGKTVIMKANIVDYFEYIRDKNPQEIEIIITSPLKELINQLQSEMGEFFTNKFFRDFKLSYKIETTQGLISRYENESHEIIGENQYRLLLVDEAHIGLASKEKGAFVNIRNELTKNISNSFMFEYSATFYDVKDKKQIDDYANRIVFEYDYGKFYNDKYGKDFKFGVIKKDEIAKKNDEDIKRNLDVNIEAFIKKLDSFDKYNKEHKQKQFPNRPLLIMAGNTVSASNESKANNEENSDIAKIIGYFAELENIDNSVKIFRKNKGILHLLQNSSSDGEVLLSFGEDSTPFGLITVGNVKKFLENSNIQKLISENKIISKTLKFTNENFLFKNIDFDSSPINILIGSRKFSAGWNSFRASQICLINFGTGSGSTIIQMFGRGVRLRGLNDDGKRQELNYVDEEDGTKSEFLKYSKSHSSSVDKYELLKYLETLFIYSLRSTYLSKFVEEDTDIYKKSITFSKSIEVAEKSKDKKLPIFYVDKSFQEFEKNIDCDLYIKNKELNINYTINKEKSTSIDLPIILNFSVEQKEVLEYESYRWLFNFIDKSYFEKLFENKKQKNNLLIDDFNLDYILILLENSNIKVLYDDNITTPIQLQKLLIKVIDTLISKIKNRIKYNENHQSYKFSQIVTDDDFISQYKIHFILKENSDSKKVRDILESDDSYKIFVDKITNHYYKPLAIDPMANTKPVFETFKSCLNKDLTQNMDSVKDSYDKYFENIESIKITPDKLNPYEFKFICDMQKYISDNKIDATILRNKSSGNIGLVSDDGVFYPDFIIWYKDKNSESHLVFCDSKGIRNPEIKWKVCDAPYVIKNVEESWKENIKLHSFIISNTNLRDIYWDPIEGLDIEMCDKFYNLVFFEDEGYIERIFGGLNTDIRTHKIFQKYIKYFNNDVRNEWLDDEKREEHLVIIHKIMDEEKLDEEQALYLYFNVWEQKDKIEEKLKEEVKDELKEQAVTEILGEILSETILDTIPYARTGIKIFKLLK